MTTFKREFDFLENLNEIVSKNVRKYRKLANLNQEELSEAIDITSDYLRRFETPKGREGISLKTLTKISLVLDVPLDNFIKDED